MSESSVSARYASHAWWASKLTDAILAEQDESSYVVSLLRTYDLTTVEGVKALSKAGVAALQNNLAQTPDDAIAVWQMTQCLKKFKYGPAISPEEMMAGWLERNSKASEPRDLPLWVDDEIRKLLEPLGPAYEWATGECQGRFSDGAVYEKNLATTLARWNRCVDFPYNVRDPDCVGYWRVSSQRACRASCVPKDMFKLRSITVEPAEATFLQQLTRSRLITAAAAVLPKSSAIPSQYWGGGSEEQRNRALHGSLTGRTATIDLSDASDSVRWDVVSSVFPCNIVADLERSRSDYCEVNGTRYRVHMYAGMGNATTFIVESIYFWALCTVLSRWLWDLTPVSVYGDDIVLSTRVALHPLFQEYLARAGLTLNMEKSGMSLDAGFREACGLCAYKGTELPLLRIAGYSDKQPEELVSLYTLINKGLDPGSRYAPFVRRLMINVATEVRDEFHCPVLPCPLLEAGCYLIDPDMTTGEWSYRSRWDSKEQHPQVRVRVLRPTRGKTCVVRDLTWGEKLGVLSGQLRTRFADAQAGFSSRKTFFDIPAKGFEWSHRWVACWSTGPELVDLLGNEP